MNLNLDKEFMTLNQAIDAYFNREEEDFQWIPTGLDKLDSEFVGPGIRTSSLIVVGGASNSGKTAFALSIASNMAKYFKELETGAILFCSGTLSNKALIHQILSFKIGEDPTISNYSYNIKKKWEVSKALKSFPFYTYCKPVFNIDQIRKHAGKIPDLKTIFIDGLESIQANNQAEAIQRLKNLATELKVAIMITKRLSFGVENDRYRDAIWSDFGDRDLFIYNTDAVLLLKCHYDYVGSKKGLSAEESSRLRNTITAQFLHNKMGWGDTATDLKTNRITGAFINND